MGKVNKRFGVETQDEANFLRHYDINRFERPSVAADVVVLSVLARGTEGHRKDDEQELSILLVKRGEHPFKNCWALPGGFLKPEETVEQCAARELKEETNITPTAILPIGVFSEPDRDPRGRIISNAFACVISEEKIEVMGGSDAAEANWFTVKFDAGEDDLCILELKRGQQVIRAELRERSRRFASSRYEVLSCDGLAFDHAEIIAAALNELRSKAEDIRLAFEFLPDRFTLSALQKVQETLLGVGLLTANFRRKVSAFVEETEEYTEGAGHRPARLFKRRDG